MRERLAAAWRRSAVAAGAAFGAIILVSTPGERAGVVLVVLCVLVYAIGVSTPTRDALLGLVASVGPSTAGVALAGGAWLPMLFAVAPWGVGRGLRAQRELAVALERRTRELEVEQDAYARLAVRHERARIARELHDVVSHDLAAVVVQAGAGRVAPPTAQHRAAGRFANIRTAGEHGLEELARLARMLDPPSAPDPAPLCLDALVAQASAAGLRVRTDTPGGGLPLPAEVALAAYRIVQEALTNALKHAAGAELTVRVRLAQDGLEVEVCDDGAHAAGTHHLGASGSGSGLAGMRARVSDLGGELQAGERPGGGWRVWARLPVVPTSG